MIKVLIVEDEKSISDLINISLTSDGYYCDCSFDGMDAADKIENNNYDLILLDIMIPSVDGYELMEYIRPLEVPVIFITAKSKLQDKVKGLKLGADDYITKPFEILELLARVESVLRRYHKQDKEIVFEDLEINTESHIIKKRGEEISLTMKEYELLLLFIRNKNIALFRDKIYEQVWECDFNGDTRTVDIHVQRLRKKLGWEKKIVSVHKIGYRLEA